ncbi:MAG TPA: maleylpyruvate isomerase family mycothiol-dependent enzyme [Acidimicrobiales bacterium]|jgi:uncharacterized protein (TIGR03083 family)
MASDDPWPLIHAEREALAADLATLTDEQWATPSLCDGWTVRDVVAHMTATAKMTPPKFFGEFIGSGFRFNAMTAKDVARERGASPSETLAGFRDRMGASTHPPGPIDAMVGEVAVHPEDIRRPLGISHSYPADLLTRAADFYKSSNLLIGGKKRVAGLTLKATDVDWTSGSGPEVTGPMLSMVLMIAGRRSALAELSGEGVSTLQSRM